MVNSIGVMDLNEVPPSLYSLLCRHTNRRLNLRRLNDHLKTASYGRNGDRRCSCDSDVRCIMSMMQLTDSRSELEQRGHQLHVLIGLVCSMQKIFSKNGFKPLTRSYLEQEINRRTIVPYPTQMLKNALITCLLIGMLFVLPPTRLGFNMSYFLPRRRFKGRPREILMG